MKQVAHISRLEPRYLLSAMTPTAVEQYMLELVNRARANPTAEATMDGIALNEGLPAGTISAAAKQPLAFNPYLIGSATQHDQWMLANDNFTIDEGRTGYNTPADRITTSGYNLTGSWSVGENLGWSGSYPTAPSLIPTVTQEQKAFFVDASEPGRGYRLNVVNPNFKEIGIGVATGVFPNNGTNWQAVMSTQDYAVSGTGSFLTGVAYKDSNHNNFYDVGEGLGGITITAQIGKSIFTTTTWSSGGYSLKLNPGTYTVTASGAALGTTSQVFTVTIGSLNVEQDFHPGVVPPPKGSIAGSVFNDLNDSATHESNEPGVAGFTIQLHNTADANLAQIDATTQTSATGAYSFSNLVAGTYVVKEVLPTGWRATTASALTITLAAGQNTTAHNFLSTQKGEVNGTVFWDKNANNKPDSGEGLAGWTVDLEQVVGGQLVLIANTTTTSTGTFHFGQLIAGNYVLKVEQQAGYTLTSPVNDMINITITLGSDLTNEFFIEKH